LRRLSVAYAAHESIPTILYPWPGIGLRLNLEQQPFRAVEDIDVGDLCLGYHELVLDLPLVVLG